MTMADFRKQSLTLAVTLALCLGLAATTVYAADEAETPSIAPTVEIAAPPMPDINHPTAIIVQEERIAADETHADAKEPHAEEKSAIGFPQLDPSTYASQIFWLTAAFFLLYALMSKLALPRIEAVLENRRSQREGNLEQAEQLKSEAEKIRAAYEDQLAKAQDEAQKVLSEMESDLKEISMARNAAFAENARKSIAHSENEIAKAKDAAMASVADIAADITVEASGKIASCAINRADAKKTVQSLMKKEAA